MNRRLKHNGDEYRNLLAEPFHSGEEAWAYYCTFQRQRNAGTVPSVNHVPGIDRPCSPRDVCDLVFRMRRAGMLSQQKCAVLFKAVDHEFAADVCSTDEVSIFDKAIERLENELERCGWVTKTTETRKET